MSVSCAARSQSKVLITTVERPARTTHWAKHLSYLKSLKAIQRSQVVRDILFLLSVISKHLPSSRRSVQSVLETLHKLSNRKSNLQNRRESSVHDELWCLPVSMCICRVHLPLTAYAGKLLKLAKTLQPGVDPLVTRTGVGTVPPVLVDSETMVRQHSARQQHVRFAVLSRPLSTWMLSERRLVGGGASSVTLVSVAQY